MGGGVVAFPEETLKPVWSDLHMAITFLLSLDFFMPSFWIYACVPTAPNRLLKFPSAILPSFVILWYLCWMSLSSSFLQVLFMTHGLPFLHCFLILSPIWNHLSHLFCWFLTRPIPGGDPWPFLALSHSFCLFLVLCFMTDQCWMCWVLGLEQFKTTTWGLC